MGIGIAESLGGVDIGTSREHRTSAACRFCHAGFGALIDVSIPSCFLRVVRLTGIAQLERKI